jgi:hypothetical protein
MSFCVCVCVWVRVSLDMRAFCFKICKIKNKKIEARRKKENVLAKERKTILSQGAPFSKP